VSPPDEDAAACEAVVLGPVPTLATVGDFEPLAQAATVKTKPMTTADLPATAVAVDEATRRRVITAILDLQNRPEIAARVSQRQHFDDWFARSPLVEIVFDDEQLRTVSSA
jgi:hypothetical protein